MPLRRARTSQCPRVPLPPSGTGTAIARPASEPCSITNIACRPASGPLVDLGADVDAARCASSLLRMAGELDAAVVQHRRPETEFFHDRLHDLEEPTLGEHEPSSSAWTSTLRSSA